MSSVVYVEHHGAESMDNGERMDEWLLNVCIACWCIACLVFLGGMIWLAIQVPTQAKQYVAQVQAEKAQG